MAPSRLRSHPKARPRPKAASDIIDIRQGFEDRNQKLRTTQPLRAMIEISPLNSFRGPTRSQSAPGYSCRDARHRDAHAGDAVDEENNEARSRVSVGTPRPTLPDAPVATNA